MTPWVADEYGNLRFTCEGWTLTRWASDLGKIDVLNSDGDLELDVYEDRIFVKGESRHGYETSALSVSVPFPVLRAILEVVSP